MTQTFLTPAPFAATFLSRRALLGAAAALPLTASLVTRPASAAPATLVNNSLDAVPWTETGTIERVGGRLAWYALGPKEDREPIILLHKLGGWAADWRIVASLLGSDRRVIALDLPGHGNSVMQGLPPYIQTVPETAAMLLAALDELGIERAAFAGNSLGGIIAAHISALWPQRVNKLILASVSLSAGYDRQRLSELESNRNPLVYTADWRPIPRAGGQGSSSIGTLDPAIEVEQDASRARADRWIRPSERGVGLFNMQAALAKTVAPLLFIYGDRGHYVKYVETGKTLRRDAKIVQFAHAGSFIHQERPQEVAAAIREFLGPKS